MYYSTYQVPPAPQQRFQIPAPILPKPSAPQPPIQIAPYEPLTINVPLQEYKLAKIVPIPFDPRESKGARFVSLYEALQFISRHCMHHHGFFTKPLSKKYLEFCRILDGPTGKFTVMKHFNKKEFDASFNKVRQQTEGQKFTK